ncbi:hypothetical protein [Prochlorococcus sp. MIT 1341]|uniref:hypothetical protein n=1 Tax=Prochlorococcus sp. MIT 1341 TaxID=3096221 RepID=UPI002A7607EA|nr:hypothetical protein [Prochlorococcus sp. MIT 1341]
MNIFARVFKVKEVVIAKQDRHWYGLKSPGKWKNGKLSIKAIFLTKPHLEGQSKAKAHFMRHKVFQNELYEDKSVNAITKNISLLESSKKYILAVNIIHKVVSNEVV